MSSTNEAAPIVAGYTQKQMLAKLGYTFDGNELSVFDVECYAIIANRFAELEEKQMKRKK